MGIAFSFLPFLDACFEQRALLSPVLALGALKIHEPPERIAALAGEHAYAHLARDHSVRALLRDRYEVSAYQDCDVNGLADLHLDLGKPLDETWDGRFGTVLNGGTVEHVFDVRQAMTNIHRLVRPGGTMIHLAPVTW
ncbi:MAG TPA: methyltransferase domain-containing protein, partial [Nitrospira sp.]|nr:methyltransferase domain-containing protein [Nitrospira sp.]